MCLWRRRRTATASSVAISASDPDFIDFTTAAIINAAINTAHKTTQLIKLYIHTVVKQKSKKIKVKTRMKGHSNLSAEGALHFVS